MFNLIGLENILSSTTEIILCIATIIGILKFEETWQKWVSALVVRRKKLCKSRQATVSRMGAAGGFDRTGYSPA